MTDSDTKMTCKWCGKAIVELFGDERVSMGQRFVHKNRRLIFHDAEPAEPAPVAQAAGCIVHGVPDGYGCSICLHADSAASGPEDCPMCESDCPGGAHRNALHEDGITTKEQYRQACASEPPAEKCLCHFTWKLICDDPLCKCFHHRGDPRPVPASEPEKPPIPDDRLNELLKVTDPQDENDLFSADDYPAIESAIRELIALRSQVAELTTERDRLRLLQFSPTGDNHHNAAVCPYCSPDYTSLHEQLEAAATADKPLVFESPVGGSIWKFHTQDQLYFIREHVKFAFSRLESQLEAMRVSRDECLKALKEAMKCEACDGSGTLSYPPSCNCYEEPECTHPEIEAECCACNGTKLRDIPEGIAAINRAEGK